MKIRLRLEGNIVELKAGIDIFSRRFGFDLSEEGIMIKVEKSAGNIYAALKGNVGIIRYDKKIHFFRALGLFIEALKESDCFTIHEEPQFDTNGACLDCSRNGVLKVESIKEIIEMMAAMGLNFLALYMEDTYTIDSEPYFGYMRGRYSYEELKKVDDHADIFGIEAIPCIQTLAHLEQFLKWEAATHLKDTDTVMLAGYDGTYKMVEKMIQSASAPFRSRRIHIGMDEAYGLGRGTYLETNGYRDSFDIMNEHLSKVIEIAERYGLKPIIWSDMFFSLASKSGNYLTFDTEASIPQEVIEKIPKGIQMTYWDYFHHDKEFYSSMIQKHNKMGFVPIFAGGIWTWIGFCTNYGRTIIDSCAALSACKKEGIREVIATMWGDDGMENNYYSALLGLQLFAEHGYSKQLDMDKLKRRVEFCTGIAYDAFIDMGYLDEIPGVPTNNTLSLNPSKYLLWQDLLLGLFDRHIIGIDTSTHYASLEEKIRMHKEHNAGISFVLEVLERLCAVLKIKSDMGLRLKKYYDLENKEVLREAVEKELPCLYIKINDLRKAHYNAWFRTYKPFGWEVIDIRYGGLLSRVDSTIIRLKDYVEGRVERIEELEEERLAFNGSEQSTEVTLINCESYSKIVTPNAF